MRKLEKSNGEAIEIPKLLKGLEKAANAEEKRRWHSLERFLDLSLSNDGEKSSESLLTQLNQLNHKRV